MVDIAMGMHYLSEKGFVHRVGVVKPPVSISIKSFNRLLYVLIFVVRVCVCSIGYRFHVCLTAYILDRILKSKPYCHA